MPSPGYMLSKTNVPWLLGQVKEFYTTKVAPLGGPPVFEKTAEIVVRERKWGPTESMFRGHLASTLEELNVVYIPKVLQPGPAVLFPMLDVRDRYTLARLWPLYKLLIREEPVKYAFLGNRADTIGPAWLGMSHATIERLIRTQAVVLVEGPFDMLACRLLAPDVPVLSTGTKNWNDMHVAHLRMLGVKTVHVLFDSDEAGENASSFLSRKWNAQLDGQVAFKTMRCPGPDPSDCLSRREWARALRTDLRRVLSGGPNFHDLQPEEVH
jgi:5S rRNA maturation endonuclease (ribonuclease M5)